MINNETPKMSDEQMNGILAHVDASIKSGGDHHDISDVRIAVANQFYDVQVAQACLMGNPDFDGDKKESAGLIRGVFGLKGNSSYQTCIDAVETMLSPEGDSSVVAEYIINIVDGHVEDEQDDIVDVVEDEASHVDVPDFDARLDALEASFTSALKQITDTIGKMAATPQQPVVETVVETKSETPAPAETVEYGLKTNNKRLHTPFILNDDGSKTAWKDKVNWTVGVITDTVDKINGKDGQHPIRHARGMTEEQATAMGRNIVRRRLTMRIKGLRAKTQGKDWATVAAKHGITDAVCDEFLTKPNKHALQARRTGANIRNRLGITNVVSFNKVADEFLNGDVETTSTPAPKASVPPLVQPKTTPSNGVATVDTSKILELMNQGFTAAQAKDYLASL